MSKATGTQRRWSQNLYDHSGRDATRSKEGSAFCEGEILWEEKYRVSRGETSGPYSLDQNVPSGQVLQQRTDGITVRYFSDGSDVVDHYPGIALEQGDNTEFMKTRK